LGLGGEKLNGLEEGEGLVGSEIKSPHGLCCRESKYLKSCPFSHRSKGRECSEDLRVFNIEETELLQLFLGYSLGLGPLESSTRNEDDSYKHRGEGFYLEMFLGPRGDRKTGAMPSDGFNDNGERKTLVKRNLLV